MKMNKRLAVIAAIILLMLIPAFSTAWAVSWVKMVYDTKVSSQTKEDYQLAIDMVDILFTKYKIVLSDPVTVVVAADDDESFIRAIMSYGNMSRAQAEKNATSATGLNFNTKSLIIIRYRPTRAKQEDYDYIKRNRSATLLTLAHELFHQVRHQNYSHARPVNWLEEGSANLFKYMAQEIAGTGTIVTGWVGGSREFIRKAAKIPDTRQLASYDYKDWDSLMQQEYPVYQMAAVMTYRLVGDDGFGKVLVYYQLLHNGTDPDKAFITAFGMPMSKFLADMNEYFNKLRSKKE
jgi:hypothetical protein